MREYARAVREPPREYSLSVRSPYRLDVTVQVLRRFATNVVDVLLGDGTYVRVLPDGLVRVRQEQADSLTLRLDAPVAAHPRMLATVSRILGVDRDLTPFDRAARRVPWLAPLAKRMRGVKPPRYPTLWEACVNAIVFQQISLLAASSILRRVIVQLADGVDVDGTTVHPFPSVDLVGGATDQLLRGAGLSAGKVSALRHVGDAGLDETVLDALPSAEVAERLCQVKGIGPWTAAVILLRGFGRLDVFPQNDSGAARSAKLLLPDATPADIDRAVAALEPQQGMLYYHFLLARLTAKTP